MQRERDGEREGGRNSSYQIIQTGPALLSSQIGHGSQIQAVPTWPPSTEEPRTGKLGEREITKKKQQHTKKLCVIIFGQCSHSLLPPQTPPPLPHRPVASFGLYVVVFLVFFLEERHSQEEGELLLPHSRFFVLSLFFPLLLLRRWSESLGLCLFFPSSSLCLFFRASEPIWMRWESGAQRCSALYGSCGLQDRGRQLHVASRTWSHAFPRDLRGSHPRNHGGDGEKVENGVSPGEGHAAERKRVGKSQAEPCVK